MPVNIEKYKEIIHQLEPTQAQLVAVSKVRSPEDIMALYHLGQRDFGENYVQELVDKQSVLPQDIRWHFIGHLQTNKVKQIASFVYLIHGVDSIRLLEEISKQGAKLGRKIGCLLQVHIAEEESKFGFSEETLAATINEIAERSAKFSNLIVYGLMGMASFTDKTEQITAEFMSLKHLYYKYQSISSANVTMRTLSMGMSDDYPIAIEQGSTMVRIGSLLFGKRS